MQPALFFDQLPDQVVQCRLCPHDCRLRPGQTGLCHVRHNVDGVLLTSSYGRPVLMAVEPMEKKYLFHVYPGCQTLSLGTPGCNLGCHYCINWRVSQRGADAAEADVPPAVVIDKALAAGAQAVAFTYTEPTIFIEYALAIARLARTAGLAVVAKSNGYLTPTALLALAPWLDAINLDLKAWQPARHQQVTGGALEPILATLRLTRQSGLWLEVSTLVVPGLNDDPQDLAHMAAFIADELGEETPWHLLRFFPNYRLLDQPSTAQQQLQAAVDGGRRAGLRFIYSKGLTADSLNTACHHCQTTLIVRDGYRVVSRQLNQGGCPTCGQPLAGVGLVPTAIQ